MMRSSVDPNDPGFKNFAYGKYEVFLNGKPVRLCITADEEEGFVLVHNLDETGRPYMNAEGTETVKKVLKGKVEILEKHQNEQR